jgi:hypothetical protein
MSNNQIDLANVFQAVAQTVASQKDTLNKADTYNNDHGDHMVDIFQTIANVMQETQGSQPAEQLAKASQQLSQKQSGSAQVYAQGLAQAAKQFSGQEVTGENAMQLVQTLLGGGQAPAASSQSGTENLLNAMLGGAGSDKATQGQGGGLLDNIDVNDVLTAGAAFLTAKQQGSSNLEAAAQALVSSSAMSGSTHREQSGKLVASALLQALGSMSKKK